MLSKSASHVLLLDITALLGRLRLKQPLRVPSENGRPWPASRVRLTVPSVLRVDFQATRPERPTTSVPSVLRVGFRTDRAELRTTNVKGVVLLANGQR